MEQDEGMGTPPATPPSSPLPLPNRGDDQAPRYLTRERIWAPDEQQNDLAANGGAGDDALSPTSVSISAVSATEQPRYAFPEMSASIDATPTPRYLGRYGMGAGVAGGENAGQLGALAEEEDTVEAELRRMAQRQLPRGDLGRLEWRLDTFTPQMNAANANNNGAPMSPTSSIASYNGDDMNNARLPRPPASPPTSPGSRSRSASSSRYPEEFSATSRRSPATATSQGGGNGPDSAENLSGALVWGTNISVSESMQLFRMFLHQFEMPDATSASSIPQRLPQEAHYLQVLRELALTQSPVFNLDTQHLLQYRPSRKVYNQLVLFPQVLIRILDMVVQEEFKKLHPELSDDELLSVQVRPYNLSDLSPMRNLNPADIDQLVCLKGMVTRVSAIIPDLKEAFFRCTVCHFIVQVELDRGRIDEPSYCSHCQTRLCMEMIHNRCSFTDKQMVKMQETPDAIPEGETPYTVMLFAFDDLVDDVRPGDKIEVTGIYRAVPLRASSRQRVVKSVFKTYIDVVHFRRVDELTRRANAGNNEFTAGPADEEEGERTAQEDLNHIHATQEAKLQEFRRIAAHPNVYENLAHSLAPSIWELDDVKKGILCMLFGGTRKDKTGRTAASLTESNGGGLDGALLPTKTLRSDMNILLCGDPGTSKSQLLSYVHKLSPRSIYTSGKGSSAVGLTASIIRDMETGDLVLESGALVLSDEGICCIDEFDKMSDSARSVLHEVMEQQTVSIAKAGIICSLNARASILASANPIESRYNPNKSVIENVNILPTLLSRFDLIYLILDKPQPESDRQLAKHIVALYFDDETRLQRQRQNANSGPQLISMKLLTEYISYAKKHIHPRLSAGARDALVRAYLELRRMGGVSASRKNITATPRQLESLIRIAEALARMKFCELVDRRDVDEALRLMNVATQRTAMDPRTGTIDMDMINTGHSTSERESIMDMTELMKNMLSEAPNQSMAVGEVRKQIEETRKSEIKGTEFQMALRSLEDDNLIQVSHGVVRFFGEPVES